MSSYTAQRLQQMMQLANQEGVKFRVFAARYGWLDVHGIGSMVGGTNVDTGELIEDVKPEQISSAQFVVRCLHAIRHWMSEWERLQIVKALEYAREVGDLNGIRINMAKLTEECDARNRWVEQAKRNY